MKKALKNIGIILFVAFVAILVVSCNSSESSPVTVDDDGGEGGGGGGGGEAASMIVDHTCCDISAVPRAAVQDAIDNLHICYGHTSHGSQLVTGMDGLADFLGDDLYNYSNGGTGGTLDLHDMGFYSYGGAYDLGSPDGSAWATSTRGYLDDNPDVNVVIWSWCGQVSIADEAYIQNYLSLMSLLEQDYPSVSFVYMTGHLDGSREVGNLFARNEQIRAFCRENDKILYDFADIESYDPDGVYYVPLRGKDTCEYDSNNDASLDSNWAIDWQNAHPGEWYACAAAHTEPLNANRKAYAAWYLWARLGGWDGN